MYPIIFWSVFTMFTYCNQIMLLQASKIRCSHYRWLFYFSYLHCFWEDHSRVLSPFFAYSIFHVPEVRTFYRIMEFYYFIHRYGGGMSSAKAALESDTRVSSHHVISLHLICFYHVYFLEVLDINFFLLWFVTPPLFFKIYSGACFWSRKKA